MLETEGMSVAQLSTLHRKILFRFDCERTYVCVLSCTMPRGVGRVVTMKRGSNVFESLLTTFNLKIYYNYQIFEL